MLDADRRTVHRTRSCCLASRARSAACLTDRPWCDAISAPHTRFSFSAWPRSPPSGKRCRAHTRQSRRCPHPGYRSLRVSLRGIIPMLHAADRSHEVAPHQLCADRSTLTMVLVTRNTALAVLLGPPPPRTSFWRRFAGLSSQPAGVNRPPLHGGGETSPRGCCDPGLGTATIEASMIVAAHRADSPDPSR